MKKFALCINADSETAKREADSAVKLLEGLGAEVVLETDGGNFGFDCVISVGGDGTFLRAAKLALKFGIPVLGINVGRLGFMTELEVSETGFLKRLMTREYRIEQRMLLDVNLLRDGQSVFKAEAVNDAVIHMGDKSRMIDVKLYAEGSEVSFYRADGLLFSTPTGSTGYSLSAGGPIVEPHVECITSVPICAHGFNSRPIVFSSAAHLRAVLSNMKGKNAYVSVDGAEGVPVLENDAVEISRSEDALKVIKFGSRSFYEQLGAKMKF